ncbi:MAG TPA: hypothetical protein VF799_08015, partial [Geobacteraceae bacterium]
LIIDDSTSYVEALFRDAQRLGIHLLHARSLEDGKELFGGSDGGRVAGIILDVKCLKEKGQEVPDNSFLVAALKYFGDKAPHLPVVVLTGETDQYRNLKELYAGTMRVFSKGSDEAEMFAFMAAEAGNIEWLKIVRQYGDVFDGLGDYLGMEAEQELLSCLKNMQSDDFTVIKNNLGCLRRIQEKIYIALSKTDCRMVPPQYVAGEINVIAAYKHLAEKGYVERYKVIDRFAELVFKITSDSGAHTPYGTPKYLPTRFTVQAVTFALLDILLWFKQEMKAGMKGEV